MLRIAAIVTDTSNRHGEGWVIRDTEGKEDGIRIEEWVIRDIEGER